MTTALRPRRSVLYMPGANERALEKAKGLPADALILDLEDAVAPDAKAGRTRPRVRGRRLRRLRQPRGHDPGQRARHRVARRRSRRRGQGRTRPRWSCPKINSAAEVDAVERALENAGAPDHTMIWAMLETPIAVLHAEEIAASSERLAVLVMGTNDLAKELHAEHRPRPPAADPRVVRVPRRGAAPPARSSSTASTTTSPTPTASRPNACRAASSASTARR